MSSLKKSDGLLVVTANCRFKVMNVEASQEEPADICHHCSSMVNVSIVVRRICVVLNVINSNLKNELCICSIDQLN